MGGISSMRRGDARWQGMMTSDDKKKIRWACAFAKPGIKKKNYDKISFRTERAFNVKKNMILYSTYDLSGIKQQKMRTFTYRALQCGVKYEK